MTATPSARGGRSRALRPSFQPGPGARTPSPTPRNRIRMTWYNTNTVVEMGKEEEMSNPRPHDQSGHRSNPSLKKNKNVWLIQSNQKGRNKKLDVKYSIFDKYIAIESGNINFRHLHQIKSGDYVITPSEDNKSFHYGKIKNKPYNFSDYDRLMGHRWNVHWKKTKFDRQHFIEYFGIRCSQNVLFKVPLTFQQFEKYLSEILPVDKILPVDIHKFNNKTREMQRNNPSENEQNEQVEIDEDESGLEAENTDDSVEEIIQPFEPEKIKIDSKNLLVGHLVSRVEHNELDLQPDFQRERGIWKLREQSRLIESLLLRIPIPVFYVSADQEDNWSVVDGVQRMSTIYDFVHDEFQLEHLEYMKQYDHFFHKDLPRSLQRRISETELVVNVIDPSTPTEVMFNIFTRINTGGTQLNAQEIRHAIDRGKARELIKALAKSEEFKKATDNSIKPTRMADRECVLRFLAFCLTKPEWYSANKFDDFLTDTMEKVNLLSCNERTRFANDFKKAMRAAYAIFGDHAFRKPPKAGRYNPINKALFETWSVQLGCCCTQAQIDKLTERRQDVKERFALQLKKDVEFANAISQSTADPKHIRKRFQAVKEIVEGVINAT